MKVLSLFSGVGGFDMGLENAGMETVFQCEWDKHANSILYKHWPDVPKWDDVSTLTGKHILAHAPVVDVVAWGSPCQDLSVAGKRAGLEGGRSSLFHEGIRIIKELQEETNGQYPRISIWENVVGALNSNGGADFGIILNEMAEAGAVAVEWSVLDAQYFGIPQRRRRVFVIAIFDPVLAERCPNPLLPVSESLPGHLTKGKPARKSAATTLTEGVGVDGTKLAEGFTPSSFANYTEGVGTLRSNGGDLGGGSETLLAFDTQFGSNANVTENVSPTLKASQQSPSVAYDAAGFKAGQGSSAGSIGYQEGVAQTLTSDMNGVEPTVLTPTMAVRRLTPLECERLMGWPDDHTRYKADGTEQADTHRYKQAGNGVASPVAQWIAKHILAI
jgi:DNA (cytosine-5)-methyltransferase 1